MKLLVFYVIRRRKVLVVSVIWARKVSPSLSVAVTWHKKHWKQEVTIHQPGTLFNFTNVTCYSMFFHYSMLLNVIRLAQKAVEARCDHPVSTKLKSYSMQSYWSFHLTNSKQHCCITLVLIILLVLKVLCEAMRQYWSAKTLSMKLIQDTKLAQQTNKQTQSLNATIIIWRNVPCPKR